MLLAYIGPETTIPLLSAIAGVGGAILMFGKSALRFVVRRAGTAFGFGRRAQSLAGGDTSNESPSAR